MEKLSTLYVALLTLIVSVYLSQRAYASAYHPPNDSVLWDAFHHWQHEYGKIYGDDERKERFLAFK